MFEISPQTDLVSDVALLDLEPSIDEQAPRPEGRTARFVTFYFGERLYGVPAQDVLQVSHPLAFTPLPNAPDCLLGIAPLRGEIVAVIDLKALLGEVSGSSQRPKFVILRSETDETASAFPVDLMHEFITVSEDEFVPSSDPGKPYLSGRASLGDVVFDILDPRKISASLR